MTYTDEQVKKIAVDAFRLGMRIGEKRAARSLTVSDETPEDHGCHLRVIQGGIR